MGNDGVQLPAKAFDDGKLVGTEIFYADGKFDTPDGKARFMASPWKGLLEKVAKQKEKYRFWINNGRVNEIWQTAYHDRHIEFRRERFPMSFIEMNPQDAAGLGIASGDVVEIKNDYGAVHAMAYLEPQIKPAQTFMLFAYPFGIAGDVTTDAVDENVVPYYKGTWADIRRVGSIEEFKRTVSFKSRRFR
jgi:arsenite oxidase large subunit